MRASAVGRLHEVARLAATVTVSPAAAVYFQAHCGKGSSRLQQEGSLAELIRVTLDSYYTKQFSAPEVLSESFGMSIQNLALICGSADAGLGPRGTASSLL